MSFSSELNDCFKALGCSNRTLAERSGLSASAVSRYRSGSRTPSDAKAVRDLAHGIASVARDDGVAGLCDERAVFRRLSDALAREDADGLAFCRRLDMLMDVLGISNADMARYANIDPSYLSRMRNGARIPQDVGFYASTFAGLAARRMMEDEHAAGALADVLVPRSTAFDNMRRELSSRDKARVAHALSSWLTAGDDGESGSGAERFLEYLDGFDLNAYMREVRYDEIKVPTVPLVMPRSHTYYGVERMREAELEFLRTTATSREARDVTMYSNMPMAEMSQDTEFARRYVMGMGAMLRRGLDLSVIHDLNRPFDEMMLGLEGFIPLYMTGQISPYYLRDEADGVFCQLLNVSDVAVLEAECIRGHHDDGRYRFSTRREDVAYGRRRAEQLLEAATPLMRIYRASNGVQLARFEQLERRRREAGGGMQVGADIFRNLQIVSYRDDLVVVSKLNDPPIHFEIRHPLLCQAIANMSPALVQESRDDR